jgi:predicted ATPase
MRLTGRLIGVPDRERLNGALGWMDAMPMKRDQDTPLQTRWQVLTGAPCSGKTTLLEGLKARGYRVVPEYARSFIDEQLARGLTLSQIKADLPAFERGILVEKVRLEAALPAGELVFLDRAAPDSIAYYRSEGLDPAEPLRLSRAFRYRTVFFLERLVFCKDAVRSECDATAARLGELIAQAYAELGYALVRVPVLDIEERIEYVLQRALDPSN